MFVFLYLYIYYTCRSLTRIGPFTRVGPFTQSIGKNVVRGSHSNLAVATIVTWQSPPMYLGIRHQLKTATWQSLPINVAFATN